MLLASHSSFLLQLLGFSVHHWKGTLASGGVLYSQSPPPPRPFCPSGQAAVVEAGPKYLENIREKSQILYMCIVYRG